MSSSTKEPQYSRNGAHPMVPTRLLLKHCNGLFISSLFILQRITLRCKATDFRLQKQPVHRIREEGYKEGIRNRLRWIRRHHGE